MRRVLLVAVGARRRTLSLSVLWQMALPAGLGLVLATTVGVTLGSVLLKMTRTPVTMDWASVLTITGVGAAVVAAVTLLSVPPLLRMMRPEGLRTHPQKWAPPGGRMRPDTRRRDVRHATSRRDRQRQGRGR